jgi:hypothetical protein
MDKVEFKRCKTLSAEGVVAPRMINVGENPLWFNASLDVQSF